MIRVMPQAELEAFARQEYGRRFKAAGTAPRVVNTGAVLDLHDDALLVYRGREYRSPPVAYYDAIRLYEVAARLADLAKLANDDPTLQLAEIGRVQSEAVRLFRALVKPNDWRRFLPRALLRNPFRDASPREVDDLLGFFWKRLTKSSVQRGDRRGASVN
jgi:hypothetical protein